MKYVTEYKWAVFPVDRMTKKPLTPHGCNDAKKDPGAVRFWWNKYPDASIGVATGSASGIIIIDEDIDRDKDKDGVHEVYLWEKENAPLPDTVCDITGRGGTHLFYSYDGDQIRNTTGLLDGVDVRGEGGYVIVPPSVHPNGTEYQWEISPDDMPMAPVDDVVLAFLGSNRPTATSGTRGEPFQVPEIIKNGTRNDTIFKAVCSMQSKGMPDEAIYAAIRVVNEKQCETPLEDDELTRIVESALRYKKGEIRIKSRAGEWHEPQLAMMKDRDGNDTDRPAQTIANAEEAIRYDEKLYGRIWKNVLADAPYVYGNLPWRQFKGWREWDADDDSNMRSYIERFYGIKSADKIMDALNNVASQSPINPIRDILEQCHSDWNGNKYVENLLPALLGAEKSDYTIAVMRLFMLGAVKRIFSPGCKFDYMMVLVGEQGKYKSTFLRMLTMDDTYFADNFNTLDGDKAFEKLRGMWIVEMAELQATKRAKDVETIKAFITSQFDNYRAPYTRRTVRHPRMCVLAGTSNPTDFLTDKTGNRRFLPITCAVNEPTVDMLGDIDQTRFMIRQAWGEIMDEYLRNKNVRLVLPKKLQQEAITAQEKYQEEDPSIGIIQAYLDRTDSARVCAMMIWENAVNPDGFQPPSKKDIREIHDIMKNSIHGWHFAGKQDCGPKYGVQRCYERTEHFVENVRELPDEIPM